MFRAVYDIYMHDAKKEYEMKMEERSTMAKKNGKVAAQVEDTKSEVVQEVTQEAENSESKKSNNLWLNGVHKSLIHEANGKDGKDYKSVNFAHHVNEAGENVMASFLVNPGQVRESNRKTKDGKSIENPDYKNVLLGTPGQHYNVSIKEADANGNYPEPIKMTTAEIKECFDTARENYKAKQNGSKAKDGIDVSVATPEVQNEGLEC